MEKVIFEFPILYEGWEMDEKGEVIERNDGSRYIRLTNHGKPYIAEVSELEEKIAEYQKVIGETNKAIELVSPTAQPIPLVPP